MNSLEPNNLIRDISPDDEMFNKDQSKYFAAGFSTLENIRTVLKLARKPNCRSILDLPCGHGRVLRYLRAEFPEAKIVACDLNQSGVDFCQATWNAQAVYSRPHFNWSLEEEFDLIWCGSLFTHIDRTQWFALLQFLTRHLTPDGVLVFSVHGRWVAKRLMTREKIYGLPQKSIPRMLRHYSRSGFGYANYPNASDYGVSITAPSFVHSALASMANMKMVLYSEKAWDNHHDIVACQRQDGIYATRAT